MTLGEALAEELEYTRDWTLRLIADLDGDDWTFQPAQGLAHALWTCGHLANAQHSLIHVRCLGKPALDEPFILHFPMGRPVASAEEHAYPPPAEVLRVMADLHARSLAEVRGMSDAFLQEPAYSADGGPHPHYRTRHGAVAHCSRHEAYHAGQIGMIRRLRGKTFLR